MAVVALMLELVVVLVALLIKSSLILETKTTICLIFRPGELNPAIYPSFTFFSVRFDRIFFFAVARGREYTRLVRFD